MQSVPSIIPTTWYPDLPPPTPSKPSDCFSDSIFSRGSPPLPISPNSLLLSISPCPPCYLLCSTNKWNHEIIDWLCLTYFTQHNLFQYRPCCYKSWVFFLSDGGIILHSVYGPHLPYPFIPWRALVPFFIVQYSELFKNLNTVMNNRNKSMRETGL